MYSGHKNEKVTTSVAVAKSYTMEEVEDFITAIQKNDVETMESFLEQGMDPNVVLDEDRISPLHFAVQYNALVCAFRLIAAGANIYARIADDDKTPLDIAILFEHKEMIDLLTHSSRKH